MNSRRYLVRGFNPPVLIVGQHPDYADSVWIVPASMPWAGARLVRCDQLIAL